MTWRKNLLDPGPAVGVQFLHKLNVLEHPGLADHHHSAVEGTLGLDRAITQEYSAGAHLRRVNLELLLGPQSVDKHLKAVVASAVDAQLPINNPDAIGVATHEVDLAFDPELIELGKTADALLDVMLASRDFALQLFHRLML